MSEWRETSLGNIPIDWDINSLGELLYIKGRIGWKGQKKSEYLKEGYAIINGEQIINGKVDWKNVGRIPKERYDESPETMLKSGDILMTKDGTIGKIALIENLPEHATVASGVFVIRKQSPRLKQKYLYYFFKSHYFNYLIKSRTEGSVIPHLYQRDFIEMEIPLPEPNEQENISKLLTKLDNKTDLLRRQNVTLEAIAQTLFKRWFVEFEFPDEKGQPYKSSGGKMVSSELGKIPEGWSEKCFYELGEYINGGAFKQEDFSQQNAGLPIIKIVELKYGITNQTKYTEKQVTDKIIINDKDILFSWSGSPETSIDIFVWNLGRGALNQHTFKVIPNKSIEKTWLYNLLKFYKPLFIRIAKQKQTTEEIETAIRQVVDKAITSNKIVDIFEAAGIAKPDISILSDEFLSEIKGMKRKNLAFELLKKLLKDEIQARVQKNIIQSKKLMEMLENAIRRYQNNLITAAEVIDELIKLARDIKMSDARGEETGMSEYELAFYDALANNESAREVMGDDKLRKLAIVLVDRIKNNASIDWSIKESVRARMKVLVKRLLRQYGYPPDKQVIATETVLQQAELFTEDWVKSTLESHPGL